jgi:hypothetical protein
VICGKTVKSMILILAEIISLVIMVQTRVNSEVINSKNTTLNPQNSKK